MRERENEAKRERDINERETVKNEDKRKTKRGLYLEKEREAMREL